ncbi:MAG: A/G-specific adenine glycosylase [Bacteroidota bacterium]
MTQHPDKQQQFRKRLMEWGQQVDRPMPWKGEKNPYFIWLSEIILQQTRVEQGWQYYLRFKSRFPTVDHLAEATEDEVLKLWEGLGYYSRARNLHKAAQQVVTRFNGDFPNSLPEILSLPGIGPYTGAAIASFAYNLPEAVLDGNVFRVLARVFDIDLAIDSSAGKKYFKQLADALLDSHASSQYNQAIMDFGAVCCAPKKPDCPNCPMQDICTARKAGNIAERPVKKKKITKKKRYFHYLRIKWGDRELLQKRTQKDIWQNLYEFPLAELDQTAAGSMPDLSVFHLPEGIKEKLEIQRKSRIYKQVLSHQLIFASFTEAVLSEGFEPLQANQFWVASENVRQYAFPKIVDCFLKDNSLSLFD